MAGLRSLSDHPLVGDVRGRGMLAAIELVTDKERKTPLPQEADPSRRIFDRAWKNGLVIRAFANGVLGYAPPLCCTDGEIDGIIERTRMTLDQTLEDKDVRAAMKVMIVQVAAAGSIFLMARIWRRAAGEISR